MSEFTCPETSSNSSISKNIQNHIGQVRNQNRLSDLNEINSLDARSTANHRTCGALHKLKNPPRPSGENIDSPEWSSDNECFESTELHSTNRGFSPFAECSLGRVNSIDEFRNRGFARVKDSNGRRTNLIYLFP